VSAAPDAWGPSDSDQASKVASGEAPRNALRTFAKNRLAGADLSAIEPLMGSRIRRWVSPWSFSAEAEDFDAIAIDGDHFLALGLPDGSTERLNGKTKVVAEIAPLYRRTLSCD
jgi:hypothetical protein